ncbi:Beta-glucoside kinase [uncultured Clostridium sp.]|uniref:ROK family protein n=1 Tax=uncultured Clostridium sp. TaxID=59620 RepID=UPI000822F808|nr:ROK family protein [uncultured Clostridium sp.]SCK02135.1 Beta-glucoside kinase [uncultured Clostridium sp.]
MYLGIDIGGTFIKYALIDENNNVVEKWKKPAELKENKDEFYDYLCDGLEKYEYEAIGISAPGVIDGNSNVLSKAAPNVLIMCGTNVNEEVSKRTNKKVCTLNDAKAAGYCEFKIGNGKGTKSSAYFVIGTGIGGCLCDDRGVIQGMNGIAGEFSPLLLDYKNGKGKFFATVASMSALIEIYNSKSAEDLKYGTEVCDKYLNHDEIAIESVNQWIDNICIGLYNIVLFFNPEVICLGGGISEEDWFIDLLREKFSNMKVYFMDICTTKIERCLYSNDSNILGAVLYSKDLNSVNLQYN